MIDVITIRRFMYRLLGQGGGVRAARMPLRMTQGDIVLRPLTVFDFRSLGRMAQSDDIVQLHGTVNRRHWAWLSLWWSIRHAFPLAYRIECDGRKVGFIALYDLDLGESARVSLAILDRNLRRKGYGGRAFRLLTQSVMKHRLAGQIIAEVDRDNHGSRLFWQKLGFTERRCPHSDSKGRLTLFLSVIDTGPGCTPETGDSGTCSALS